MLNGFRRSLGRVVSDDSIIKFLDDIRGSVDSIEKKLVRETHLVKHISSQVPVVQSEDSAP